MPQTATAAKSQCSRTRRQDGTSAVLARRDGYMVFKLTVSAPPDAPVCRQAAVTPNGHRAAHLVFCPTVPPAPPASPTMQVMDSLVSGRSASRGGLGHGRPG